MITALLRRNHSGEIRLDPVTSDDATWIFSSSFVIFTMQTGFGLMESGAVAKKNEVNILMKNAVDVVLGGLSYWMFGYGLQYGDGPGTNPFCGFGSFFLDANTEDMGLVFATFIFQLSFATTATTIVSGAMAERMTFSSYCVFSFLNTIIYCIPAGWLWRERGFLKTLGVVDFAGSSGIHLLGGTSALMAAIVLRPRIARFDKGSEPLPMGNPTYALMGTFTLWWGWLVFNCGSTFGISNNRWQYAARAAVNTVNASFGGGAVGIALSYFLHRNLNVMDLINCIMGALVSITGGSSLFCAWEAVLVGAIGAFLVSQCKPVLDKLRIDDPVAAFSVHGVCGAWGMIAVGLMVDADTFLRLTRGRKGLFLGGGATLLGIQLLACVIITTWSMIATVILLKCINFFIPIRMSLQQEILGADFTEHNIRHEGYDYEGMMSEMTQQGLLVSRKTGGEHPLRTQWDKDIVLHYVEDNCRQRIVQSLRWQGRNSSAQRFLNGNTRQEKHCVLL